MNETVAGDDNGQGTPDQVEPLATPGSRIASLDFIRGIAVMGILGANIVGFGQPMSAYMYPAAFTVPHSVAEDWMWVAQFVLIDGKMRGLFTLLFGVGMALFMEKAWARGATRWLQVRRLFWLLLFGLAHYYLVWRGDILVGYALAGFVALVAVRWSIKTQLTIGVMVYSAGAILLALSTIMPWFITETRLGDLPEYAEQRVMAEEAKVDELADGALEVALIREGNHVEFVRHTVAAHGTQPFSSHSIEALMFETVPLMLIGMALFRLGMFDGRIEPAVLRKWGWIGVTVGTIPTIAIALWTMSEGLGFYATLAAFLGLSILPRLPVVIGLAALLSLYGSHASGWLAQRVSAAGRMAFSNYLGTSLAMLLVFHGWAGGLFGMLGRTELYLVAIAACLVMLLWSKPWLARFRFGPLEWLWRCLTYWRWFPLRR